MNAMPKSQAIQHLQKVRDELALFSSLPIDIKSLQDFRKLLRNASVAVRYVFGEEGKNQKELNHIMYPPRIYAIPRSEAETLSDSNYMLIDLIALLESMIEEVENYWPDEAPADPRSGESANADQMSNKVFLVHGRDDGTKARVARFLERIKLDPVVLQEMPNQGNTIIEKFEHYASRVRFAVVLFTPDDVGSLSDKTSSTQPRPRQNVVFELGYFVGKLGRDRTCALVKGNLEMLSDYSGVIYIPLDGDGWQMHLIQELKSAGYDVDANDAFIE